MNVVPGPKLRLLRPQLLLRVGALTAIALGAVGLRLVDPASLSWWPLRTSCGAVTGLPCIFCGTTRALHHLLRGDFAQALYFNWLGLVLAAAAFAMVLIFGAELLFRRRFLFLPACRLTPRGAGMATALLLMLWILQVTLAISLHKYELLNPDGLLYALVVG